MVLPGVSEERPVKVADAIRLLVTRLHIYHPGAQRQYVTISVGIAAKSDATADELRLTRDADIAPTPPKSTEEIAPSRVPRWSPRDRK